MTVRISDILEEVSSYIPEEEQMLIQKAYVFSARVHQGQTRLSGEPYLNHPLEVAYIIAQMHLDAVSVSSALLHDTIEDSYTTKEDISQEFGDEVALVVDGLTKLSKMAFRSREEHQAENYRKMILAMSKDLRILLVKLVDRVHNMRTLEYHKRPSQVRIAQETIDIYAPLANRLGTHWLQVELEELSLKYLEPDGYLQLKTQLDAKAREKDEYLQGIMAQVQAKLDEAGIRADVKGRIKHIYSVYQKLKRQGIPFEDVYDILGVRIIVDNVAQCYEVLGQIHSMWKPIQARIKDFIAMPKENMYQSLHTTVFGPEGERIEFQIRTDEMDYIAIEGIAAHWRYKEKGSVAEHDGEQLAWLRQLLEWQQELEDPREFLQSVKIDLYPEDVYVFTPRGDVMRFPVGATPLDFAYSVHTELGHQCTGAKINGQIVPLRYKLKSGDMVEIMRSAKQHPGKDWLRIAKTTRARNKIRVWLRAQEHEQSVILGKEMVERKLKTVHVQPTEADFEKLAPEFNFKTADDLFAAVGFGRVSVNQLMHRLAPEEQPKQVVKTQAPQKRELGSSILVKGVEDLLVRFARCCRPIPGDEVVGFITRGRGITVHQRNCPYVLDADPQRLVPVEWDTTVSELHEIDFSVACEDRPGMLNAMTNVLSSRNVNISNLKTTRLVDGKSICLFRVTVRTLQELEGLFKDLRNLRGVESVERKQSA